MRINLSSNLREVIPAVDEMFSDQLPFACAVALTRTAKDGQQALYTEMDVVWDRPTPFSKRSLFIKPATKANLAASVEIKDRFPSGSTAAPDDIYQHQYEGGSRRRKGLERFATTAGLIGATEVLVPASGAKLDAYGNMARSQVVQVMSQLRLGLDPASWKTSSARSKAHRKKSGEVFWSRGGHLSRGIWMRRGRSMVPIMLAASGVTYRARMNLPRVVNATVDAKFAIHLDQAFEAAVKSAR